MDLQTLLGRVRAHESDRGIAHAMKISRTTVKKYRTWFEQEGFITRDPIRIRLRFRKWKPLGYDRSCDTPSYEKASDDQCITTLPNFPNCSDDSC